MSRLRLGLLLVVVSAGCSRRPAEVCAVPSQAGAEVRVGDANGDGAVDITDGVLLVRNASMGGPPVVCDEAMQMIVDRVTHAADAYALWSHLFTGVTVLDTSATVSCAAPEPLEAPVCGRAALAIDVPRKSSERSFEAVVRLTTQDVAVDGWSLGVTATGCEITGASTVDTAGGNVFTGDGGRRAGFERTAWTSQTAVSGVVLSWLRPASLAEGEHDLLRLDVQGPATGCAECSLAIEDGVVVDALPVDSVLSQQGQALHVDLPVVTLEVCAD